MAKKMLKRDYIGRRVKLLRRIENTNGIFEAGTVMLVEGYYRGLQLRREEHCKDCAAKGWVYITRVPTHDVELLPEPEMVVSVDDERQLEEAHGKTAVFAPQAGSSAIMVWQFDEAPEELRKLSTNGGDEDWLALIPVEMADKWIGWMDDGGAFGCRSVDEYKLPDGRLVRIGSHA